MAWRLILEKKNEFMTNNEKLLLSKLKPAVRNFFKNWGSANCLCRLSASRALEQKPYHTMAVVAKRRVICKDANLYMKSKSWLLLTALVFSMFFLHLRILDINNRNIVKDPLEMISYYPRYLPSRRYKKWRDARHHQARNRPIGRPHIRCHEEKDEMTWAVHETSTNLSVLL